MKALTVKQPWAWAIAEGAKDVENRGPGAACWSYRGPLAIHAGLAWSQRGGADDRILSLRPDQRSARWVSGAIIAVVELVDVHTAAGCCEPWGETEYRNADGSSVRDVTHLVLDDVRRLDVPVPCRGRLGLWNVPEDIQPVLEPMSKEQSGD